MPKAGIGQQRKQCRDADEACMQQKGTWSANMHAVQDLCRMFRGPTESLPGRRREESDESNRGEKRRIEGREAEVVHVEPKVR